MDQAASAIRLLQPELSALARRPLLALRGSAPHTPVSKHLFILQGLGKRFTKCKTTTDRNAYIGHIVYSNRIAVPAG